MMKKYWLIIDSYVFLWQDANKALVYNSLSGKGFEVLLSPVLERVVDSLLNIDNLYCVEVTDLDLEDSLLKQFVLQLRSHFCGDIILQSELKYKPVSIVPRLNINEQVDRDYGKIENFESFGHHVVKNLLELTIYLDGNIDSSLLFKQFIWYLQGEDILEREKLVQLFDRVQNSRVLDFNIVSRNLFEYASFDLLFEYLEKYSKRVSFYTDYRSIKECEQLDRILKKEHFSLFLLINQPFDVNQLVDLKRIKYDFEYITYITSMEEYGIVSSLSEKLGIDIKILPLFENNIQFFRENVFLNKEDILNTKWSKQDIFAHQVLNMEYFGKLSLVPSGEIYADFYSNPVGCLNESLKEIVYREMQVGKSWRKTRDKLEPCVNCIYRYLCPSPSNYEYAMGGNALCNL